MSTDFMPIGSILMHCSNTIPDNWLICNGATFSSANYPKLAEVLLDNYGSISGTDYKLPDFRGRIPISNVSTNTDNRRVGIESVTLTANQTGVNSHTHAHTIGTTSHGHSFDNTTTFGPASTNSVGFGGTGGIYRSTVGSNSLYGGSIIPSLTVNLNSSSAASTPHNNVMPYLGVNFIIKAN